MAKRRPVPEGWRPIAFYSVESFFLGPLNPMGWLVSFVEIVVVFFVFALGLLNFFPHAFTIVIIVAVFATEAVMIAQYRVISDRASTADYAMYLARITGGTVRRRLDEAPTQTFEYHIMAMRRLGEKLTLGHIDEYIRAVAPQVKWDPLYRPNFDQAMRATLLGLWKKGVSGNEGGPRQPFKEYSETLEGTLKEGDEVTLGVLAGFIGDRYSETAPECQVAAKDYRRMTAVEFLRIHPMIRTILEGTIITLIAAIVAVALGLRIP